MPLLFQNDTQPLANTPLATFNVTNGYRYVFRIVAGTCFECQYIFTIENHDFVIIGADAGNTKPYRVDSLTMSPGDSYFHFLTLISIHCSYSQTIVSIIGSLFTLLLLNIRSLRAKTAKSPAYDLNLFCVM